VSSARDSLWPMALALRRCIEVCLESASAPISSFR
jgi:hypothetical protein